MKAHNISACQFGNGDIWKVRYSICIQFQRSGKGEAELEKGAGKTTLLNIIGMLEQPDKGSVTICGAEAAGHSEGAFPGRKAASL